MSYRPYVLMTAILTLLSVAPTRPASAQTQNFTYTGTNQSFVVPDGVTMLKVYMWGAGGGAAVASGYFGGAGGYSFDNLSVTPGETLTILVGQGGITNGSATFGGGGLLWSVTVHRAEGDPRCSVVVRN